MRAVAVCCTVGRPEAEELLAMWALQSVQLPLFVALDVAPARWLPDVPIRMEGNPSEFNAYGEPADWVAQRAPERVRREAYPRTIGPMRAWAVDQAVKLWQLDAREDAVLILDDDDYYSPEHARVTMRALSAGHGALVGARNLGILWDARQQVPNYIGGGPIGPGPHATWGVPLRTYYAAGGYQEDPVEDLALLSRVGWCNTRAHDDVTHVRSQFHTASFSALQGDREALETRGELQLLPRLTPRVERLQRWCATHAT